MSALRWPRRPVPPVRRDGHGRYGNSGVLATVVTHVSTGQMIGYRASERYHRLATSDEIVIGFERLL